MMQEKVYIVVTKFFPRPGDWRCAYLLDFVKALKRRVEVEGCRSEAERRKVLVFVEGSGEDYEVDGVKVRSFKTRYLPSNIFPFLFKKFNQRSFLKKVETVLCSTFNLQPSTCYDSVAVVHAHTANFGVYAEAMKEANPKCKTLLHHHDLQSFGLNMGALRHCWLYNMIQFPILRRMHEKIDTHVFISEASRRSFLAAPDASWTQYEDYKKQMRWILYRPALIKSSIILHNGVDKTIFCPNSQHSALSTQNSFTIGCVGNFEVLKDQMTLLKAIEILNHQSTTTTKNYNLKLRFVGSGPMLEECKQFAAEKGIDAEFLTEMRHEELPDFYRSLDFFVLPSWFEGFGCVFTEAHSCGVPFITCEGQGIDDIILAEDRDKWLCKQRDSKDLAEKIQKVINSILRLQLGTPTISLQVLNEDQDIDFLVKTFVETIDAE